jgi:hypothetical protein
MISARVSSAPVLARPPALGSAAPHLPLAAVEGCRNTAAMSPERQGAEIPRRGCARRVGPGRRSGPPGRGQDRAATLACGYELHHRRHILSGRDGPRPVRPRPGRHHARHGSRHEQHRSGRGHPRLRRGRRRRRTPRLRRSRAARRPRLPHRRVPLVAYQQTHRRPRRQPHLPRPFRRRGHRSRPRGRLTGLPGDLPAVPVEERPLRRPDHRDAPGTRSPPRRRGHRRLPRLHPPGRGPSPRPPGSAMPTGSIPARSASC